MSSESTDAATVGADLTLATEAAEQFLKALGVDLDAQGTTGTPARMARAYAELLTPRPFHFTTFPNDNHHAALVIEERIPFASLCEHHMLPFLGTADIGYLPTDQLVGLSKLARTVQWFARRPQVQERLTHQIADHLQTQVEATGVGVVLRAEHLCLSLRGARAPGTQTITTALRGDLECDAQLRREFLQLLHA